MRDRDSRCRTWQLRTRRPLSRPLAIPLALHPCSHRIAGHAHRATAAQAGRSRRTPCRPVRPAGRASGWLFPAPRSVPDSTSGTRRRSGRPGHRHAGIAAQSDDRRHVLLAQKSSGGQVARQVLDHERHGLAGAVGQRPCGQGEVVEAGAGHMLPLERLSAAAKGDPHLRDHRGQPLGDGQAGKQMAARAAAGKYDMDGLLFWSSYRTFVSRAIPEWPACRSRPSRMRTWNSL